MLNVSVERLHAAASTILRAAGTPDDLTREVVDILVESDLGGHESHGVQLIPRYVDWIATERLFPAARATILEETATTALVSGHWGYGQVTAAYGAQVAIQKARNSKVAVVGLVECNHLGRLGAYTERAVRENILMIATLGADAKKGGNTAPFGGRTATLGTNPFAFGIPTGEQPPVLFDFATTLIAGNAVRIAEAKGEPLPPGAILDKDGRPSTDPKDLREGGVMLPIAGHKGYGLAVCAELLGNVLAPTYRFPGPGRTSGTLFIALDPTMFAPAEAYESAADAVISRIKRVPPAPGFDEVLIPGERSAKHKHQHTVHGVPLAEATWEALRASGQTVNIDIGAQP